jgi:chromosome partitioning protein
MKTVAVIADKGGVGKTTLSVHLGVAAAQRGLETLLLGCDPQACSEAWFDIRGEKEESLLVKTTQAVRIPNVIEKAQAGGAEFVVIDIGANSDNAATYAVRAADLVLIPSSPRLFDMRGIEDMAHKAIEAKKSYAVVMNRVLRGPYWNDAQAYLKAKGYPYAPLVLHERVAFTNCLNSGLTVMEFDPTGTAAQEFQTFFEWVLTMLGIQDLKTMAQPA